MRLLTVNENDAGQRLDNYLNRFLKEATKGFLYKMLRKKNITLNGRKADGTERLSPGDEIRLFLSEETIEKFQGTTAAFPVSAPSLSADSGADAGRTNHQTVDAKAEAARLARRIPEILYQDEDVIILNKPAGMLSQRAKKEDISLCEILTAYMMDQEKLTEENLRTFKPGVCHRLDRNTSGVIAAGRTIKGLRCLSELFRTRNCGKFYLCLVKGSIQRPEHITGFLKKDEKSNQVTISRIGPGDKIETRYRPLAVSGGATLLEVELITGKTHQIRAHLAYWGHPIIGDLKYGSEQVNRHYRDRARVKRQMLHAWQLRFPEDCGELTDLAAKTVTAPVPEDMKRVMDFLKMKVKI